MHHCALCYRESEDPALFFISKYGKPKYICEACEKEYETATRDRDPDTAEQALQGLYEKAKQNPDVAVVEMLGNTLREANQRITEIRNGSYDFAKDEEDDPDMLLEVPEELRQDPEEAEEEQAAAEKEKSVTRGDRILNLCWLILLLCALGFVAYKIASLFI